MSIFKSSISFVAVLSVFALVGCGGGNGITDNINNVDNGSDSNDTPPASASVATPVKGPVYAAMVQDANGQVAAELKDENGNLLPKYKFAKKPAYPVTVTGGWSDQNYNGKMELDKGDILLTHQMKTFDISKPITPITTEASKNAKSIEEFKNHLKEIANKYSEVSEESISVEDLEKAGTEAKVAVVKLNVALYPELNTTNKVDFRSLYNNVIAEMGTHDNESNNTNTSVVIDIENQIFNNSNESKPEYSPDYIAFYEKLYKIPVYAGEKANYVAIYNNISSTEWEDLANNDYTNSDMYRSPTALKCKYFTGLHCTEETRMADVYNANIIFLQNGNESIPINGNESTPINGNESALINSDF